MKKFAPLIIILLISLLIAGCGKKKDKVLSKDTEEIKSILENEKKFLDAEHVYSQYFNIDDYNKEQLDIEWEDKEETINIKGSIVNGFIANNEATDNAIILSKDGVLYRKKGYDYSIIKTSEEVKRIGLYYPHEGGHDVCKTQIEIVLENNSGIHLVSFEDNGVIISSKTVEKGNFELPLCYSSEKNNFTHYLNINLDGEILFDDKKVVDKTTSKPLKAKHVIYIAVDGEEKYYIITDDDILYILDSEKNNIEAVTKVDFKVTNSTENEKRDVDVSISYEGIELVLKNVVNSSIRE